MTTLNTIIEEEKNNMKPDFDEYYKDNTMRTMAYILVPATICIIGGIVLLIYVIIN